MLDKKQSLISNFLPPRNNEITTNIRSFFKKLFKPSWFNNTIRYFLAMKNQQLPSQVLNYWIVGCLTGKCAPYLFECSFDMTFMMMQEAIQHLIEIETNITLHQVQPISSFPSSLNYHHIILSITFETQKEFHL